MFGFFLYLNQIIKSTNDIIFKKEKEYSPLPSKERRDMLCDFMPIVFTLHLGSVFWLEGVSRGG